MDEAKNYAPTNTIMLSLHEWIILISSFIVIVMIGLPAFFHIAERVDIGKDFRLNEDHRENYYLFQKCARTVVPQSDAVMLGDSVTWGRYVQNGETLSAGLSHRMGKRIANLSVNGLHPIALYGLVRHFGKDIRNTAVIVHLNPIWMNSIDEDLRGTEEKRINQPRLIPQFSLPIRSYTQKPQTRFEILLERYVSYFLLTAHIRNMYFADKKFSEWVVANPGRVPLSDFSLTIDPAQGTNKTDRMTLYPQDWEWVTANDSLQLSYFTKAIALLRSRGNRVFVIVGAINPYIMKIESAKKYGVLMNGITNRLSAEDVSYYSCPPLPENDYADASHPIASGYAIIAKQLCVDAKFIQFVDNK